MVALGGGAVTYERGFPVQHEMWGCRADIAKPKVSRRVITRAEDAQGTPNQSHISLSTLEYEENLGV